MGLKLAQLLKFTVSLGLERLSFAINFVSHVSCQSKREGGLAWPCLLIVKARLDLRELCKLLRDINLMLKNALIILHSLGLIILMHRINY